jgi:CDP-diacylglycerol--glycerol-3-phosphate 3-phosphatidyltransferase
MAIARIRKDISVRLTSPLVKILARTAVTPDILTWTGFVLSVGAGVVIGFGQLFAGGWIVLVAGIFDMLDGALARYRNHTTVFGAALDSTLDRLSEAVLLLGVLTWYARGGLEWYALLAATALVASYMVSYIRARAEGLGLECKEGLYTRAERVVTLALGLLLSRWSMALPIALGIIMVLSFITAGQRLVLVRQKAKGKSS